MQTAQERISALFDCCFSWNGYDFNTWEKTVLCFRPNENRKHVEVHITTWAFLLDGIRDEHRNYVIHIHPDKNIIICQIDITTIKSTVEEFNNNWKAVDKRRKAEKRQFEQQNIIHTQEYVKILDSNCVSEPVLPEHVLVECRKRHLYFDYGDIP